MAKKKQEEMLNWTRLIRGDPPGESTPAKGGEEEMDRTEERNKHAVYIVHYITMQHCVIFSLGFMFTK